MSVIDAASAQQYVESGWCGTVPLHEIEQALESVAAASSNVIAS